MMKLQKILSIVLITGFATAAFALNDAEISELVKTANDGEIMTADVAISKSTNIEVKKFAEEMRKTHMENNKERQDVTGKLKLKPAETDASKQMKKEAETKISDLKKSNGPAFDKAYMAAQIKMHEQVLHDLDGKLMPSATSPELKAFLEKTRPTVAKHLDHAKALHATLDQPAIAR